MSAKPRERLYFTVPLVTYHEFHECFRNFKRVELDGKKEDQLARRGDAKSGLVVDRRLLFPQPKSETRELWLWDGSQPGALGEFDDDSCTGDIADFLALQCCHLRKVVGLGHIKLLAKGGLSFVYHIRVRFTHNPKIHTRKIKIWFSFAGHHTSGRTVRNAHTGLSEAKKNYIQRTARNYPSELRVRGFDVAAAPCFEVAAGAGAGAGAAAGTGAVDIAAPTAAPSEQDSNAARRAFQESELAQMQREADELERLEGEAEDSE
jgi:hypothetical protein